MPTLTFNDLGTAAFRIIGLIGEASTPTPDQMALAVQQANFLVDDYKADRGKIYKVPREVFTLVAGQADYTIGPGGDFNRVRPESIQNAGLIIQTNPVIEIGMSVTDNADDWASIVAKGLTGLPFAIYNDKGNPLSTLRVFPAPTIVYTMALYLPTPIEEFDTSDLTLDYEFPPAYMDSILLRLARRLLLFYPRPISPDLKAMMDEAEGLVETNNVYVPVLQCQEALATRRRSSDRWYGQWLVPPYMR